jgi:hypothetical protein
MSAADIVRAAVPRALPAVQPTSGALSRAGSTARDLVQASAERFGRITAMAARLLQIDDAAIDLQDGERLWPPFEHADRRIDGPADSLAVLAPADELVVVPDTLLDDRFADAPLLVGGGRIRSYAAAALRGPGGGPVGTLSVAGSAPRLFTSADLQTLRDLARWAEDELQLASELARSAQVQRSMLPASLVSFPGWEVAGHCSPVRAVAGDFYDWYPVRGGAAITLADVMGKGMPAALIAANVRAVMRSTAPVNGVAAAVESAAETLETDLDGAGVFVTLFHAHLNEQTGVLRYIDAGHGLTVVLHEDGTTERLAPTGLPLGAGWENSWEERTVRLLPGDALVSVSDGVLDAFDGTLESLRIIEDLARSCSTAAAIVDAVTAAVAGIAPDDVSVVALKRSDVPRLVRA